jgi:metallo-beta-lactamase class B
MLFSHACFSYPKGCTTWSMQVNEQGKKYEAVIIGSLGINPGYKLIHNMTYPNIAQDYEHAIKVLKSLHCDIFLGTHSIHFDLNKKYASRRHGTINPFIDQNGYKKHITQKEHEFYAELQKQKSTLSEVNSKI